MVYLNYYPTYEGGVLSFMPQQIKTNESNYNQLILFYKRKMVASKMAALSLKWLYLYFDSTWKGCVTVQ